MDPSFAFNALRSYVVNDSPFSGELIGDCYMRMASPSRFEFALGEPEECDMFLADYVLDGEISITVRRVHSSIFMGATMLFSTMDSNGIKFNFLTDDALLLMEYWTPTFQDEVMRPTFGYALLLRVLETSIEGKNIIERMIDYMSPYAYRTVRGRLEYGTGDIAANSGFRYGERHAITDITKLRSDVGFASKIQCLLGMVAKDGCYCADIDHGYKSMALYMSAGEFWLPMFIWSALSEFTEYGDASRDLICRCLASCTYYTDKLATTIGERHRVYSYLESLNLSSHYSKYQVLVSRASEIREDWCDNLYVWPTSKGLMENDKIKKSNVTLRGSIDPNCHVTGRMKIRHVTVPTADESCWQRRGVKA